MTQGVMASADCVRDPFGYPLAEVAFTPDPNPPVVWLVDGAKQPAGEIHVRRLPHPERLETVYADVVYRCTPLEYSTPVPGRASMKLHASEFDPISAFEPEIRGRMAMSFCISM